MSTLSLTELIRPTPTVTAKAAVDGPLRCLSIDVEEYFHIEAAHGAIPPEDWTRWPSRVERSVDLLLEILARHHRRVTFFVLGDVARRQPRLARRISDAGHEVASHGVGHERLHRLNADRFRQDLTTSKSLLEDQTGRPVLGYRAPTFSVVEETAWAIDVLADVGLAYDASIFQVHHDRYGVPAAPDRPFWVEGRSGGAKVLEVPPLTWSLAGKKMPVAGGGYFRLLPLWFMKRGLNQAERQGRPSVLYFHPWEFDPDIPLMPLPISGRIRTYMGLRGSADRLEKIISQSARWSPIADALDELRLHANSAPVFQLYTH